MELLIIFFLIVLNGLFSLSEAAIIAARKTRLRQFAEKGDVGARAALELADEPNRFLSTVQIGITLIGILTGAIGGATLEHQFALLLSETPLAPYSDVIAFTSIVLLTTYLSLIIGELVPKRLALRSPETLARRIARPMDVLSRLTAPVVTLLSASTEAILWLLGARAPTDAGVTEDDITGMVKQGVEAGIFQATAPDMVEGVFSLRDRRNSLLMTPRTEVTWLNAQASPDAIRDELIATQHSRLPLCDGELDHVIGLVHTKDVMEQVLRGEPLDVRAVMTPALMVPGVAPVTRTLELFRQNSAHFAVVIGEYGDTIGVLTMQDILEEIVGEVEAGDEPEITRRADGSYLLDGQLPIDEFADLFNLEDIPGAHRIFETLGGFIMDRMDGIPKAGDQFTWGTLKVEVIDMDGNRVDKVLVFSEPAAAKDESDA